MEIAFLLISLFHVQIHEPWALQAGHPLQEHLSMSCYPKVMMQLPAMEQSPMDLDQGVVLPVFPLLGDGKIPSSGKVPPPSTLPLPPSFYSIPTKSGFPSSPPP